MTHLWSPLALLPGGWVKDVAVSVAADGRIASVTPGAPRRGAQVGPLLPAPVNVHSHAFQLAMAGLTEARGPDPRDSFWTWRQLMFRFLDQITPDQVGAIAALVQIEMLEAGYATNTEFHYLHHQPSGAPYDHLSEMAAQIAHATETTGIGLTLLPVQYQFGGCDGRPLAPGQTRFGNDPDRFKRLVESARSDIAGLPADTVLGVAPHSLRAVSRQDVMSAADILGSGPVHMHLAEQVAEVDEIRASYGARPVEWLLDNTDIGTRWCLIHCTQMEPHETTALAQTKAVAGLCPLTESSLGDGIFDGVRWLDADGRIAVGSDSNIRIALAEELRTLEHSQRLRDRSRAALATPEASTGRRLFDAICAGGAQAAGRETGQIAAGQWADLLALDGRHIDLIGQTEDRLIDSYVFAGDDNMVTDVWSAGRHMVQGGRHVKRDAIIAAYTKAVAPLRTAL